MTGCEESSKYINAAFTLGGLFVLTLGSVSRLWRK
jgi:hypothetical protein